MRRGKFWRSAAEAGGFDGVAHEHGGWSWGPTPPARGVKALRNVDSAGMDVADKSAALGRGNFSRRSESRVKSRSASLGVRNAVGADVNDCGTGLIQSAST